jgi:hypothetical protein
MAMGASVDFLLHVGGEAAALDHEAGDHAVEDGAVVVALLHIADEVGDSLRSLGGIEFEFDGAFAGFHHDFYGFGVTHGFFLG